MKGRMGTFSVVILGEGELSYDCDLCHECFYERSKAQAHRCPKLGCWVGVEP